MQLNFISRFLTINRQVRSPSRKKEVKNIVKRITKTISKSISTKTY
jgi:hypothetical protein